MLEVHFICRDCGTPCDPQAARERGGLCARCAFPARVTVRTFQLSIDRPASLIVESTSEVASFKPDPIREAIDRAAAAWAECNPKDPP